MVLLLFKVLDLFRSTPIDMLKRTVWSTLATYPEMKWPMPSNQLLYKLSALRCFQVSPIPVTDSQASTPAKSLLHFCTQKTVGVTRKFHQNRTSMPIKLGPVITVWVTTGFPPFGKQNCYIIRQHTHPLSYISFRFLLRPAWSSISAFSFSSC